MCIRDRGREYRHFFLYTLSKHHRDGHGDVFKIFLLECYTYFTTTVAGAWHHAKPLQRALRTANSSYCKFLFRYDAKDVGVALKNAGCDSDLYCKSDTVVGNCITGLPTVVAKSQSNIVCPTGVAKTPVDVSNDRQQIDCEYLRAISNYECSATVTKAPSCRSSVQKKKLHGGPVVLRPVRATPRFNYCIHFNK